jgi:hypothetical protein
MGAARPAKDAETERMYLGGTAGEQKMGSNCSISSIALSTRNWSSQYTKLVRMY